MDAADSAGIYAVAAKDEYGTSVMLTYFDNEEKELFRDVEINLCDCEYQKSTHNYENSKAA